MVAGFDVLGLKPGDHLVTVLHNRWEAATAALGLPVRRDHHHAGELARDGRANSISSARMQRRRRSIYEDVSAEAANGCQAACPRVPWAYVNAEWLEASRRPEAQPRADADAWSVMLYTSGTTAKPKGVPRRQRAERAAALAHVAQNMYPHGERHSA